MTPVASGPTASAISAELESKLTTVRGALEASGLSGIRLRGADWFAGATCGGSNVVDLTSATCAAEVFVARNRAFVLTDAIEATRLHEGEIPPGLEVVAFPWARVSEREASVRDEGRGARIASDALHEGEAPLPDELTAARLGLHPAELDRCRALGCDAEPDQAGRNG